MAVGEKKINKLTSHSTYHYSNFSSSCVICVSALINCFKLNTTWDIIIKYFWLYRLQFLSFRNSEKFELSFISFVFFILNSRLSHCIPNTNFVHSCKRFAIMCLTLFINDSYLSDFNKNNKIKRLHLWLCIFLQNVGIASLT